MARPDIYGEILKVARDHKAQAAGPQKPLVDYFRGVAAHYRTGEGTVDYGDAWNRIAYCLSYVPVGIDAFAEVFRRTFQHPESKCLPPSFSYFSPGSDLTLLSLGAGPCTELLVTLELLGGSSGRGVTCHAFDGEQGWEVEAKALSEAWARHFGRSVDLSYEPLAPDTFEGRLDAHFEWIGWDTPSIVTALRFAKWIPDETLRTWFAAVAKYVPEDTVVILADAEGGDATAALKHQVVEDELKKVFPSTIRLLSTQNVELGNMTWQVPPKLKEIASKGDAHPPIRLDLTATSLWLRKTAI